MMVEETWKRIGKEEEEDSSNDSISSRTQVMSVSVSHIEKGKNGFNTVYVGTEPTAFIHLMMEVNLGRE